MSGSVGVAGLARCGGRRGEEDMYMYWEGVYVTLQGVRTALNRRPVSSHGGAAASPPQTLTVTTYVYLAISV